MQSRGTDGRTGSDDVFGDGRYRCADAQVRSGGPLGQQSRDEEGTPARDPGSIAYSAEQGKKWIQRRYDELDEGRMKSLLKALDRQAPKYQEARECADYIRNNRNRMQYPDFHEQGLCTSTGVGEAGCKVVIGYQTQAGRHALDRTRRKRDHRPALFQTQRAL